MKQLGVECFLHAHTLIQPNWPWHKAHTLQPPAPGFDQRVDQHKLKELDTLKYGKAVIGPLANGQILKSWRVLPAVVGQIYFAL